MSANTHAPGHARTRRLAIGAEPLEGGVDFRVWAPGHDAVDVLIDSERHPLDDEGNGYFSGFVSGIDAGTLYAFSVDGGEALPDPASRYQPFGPHGASAVVDPDHFGWSDRDWRGVPIEEAVVYELHIGTFTEGGDWFSARQRLPHLTELGVTIIEVMPVAEFAGRWGWGYDGVDLFAPFHEYGEPDDFRAFVDAAHALGVGVILDVVYNHFGPSGNYLPRFSDTYMSDRHGTDWGTSPNYDGKGCEGVREFLLDNVRHWIAEYHLDGLRFDATQDIHDAGEPHILTEACRVARETAGERRIFMVAENEPQDPRMARSPRHGGHGFDSLWNDDYHHAAVVALTGRRNAYYSDYGGLAREFVACVDRGFLYQGQYYPWQDDRRGSPAFDLPASAIVTFLENHDQVANSEWGSRLHQLASPAAMRAMTSFLLLGPNVPMLFQGQEWNANSPFLFFSDHEPDLQDGVRAGRLAFLEQFPTIALDSVRDIIADPGAPETFRLCRLDWSELEQPGHRRALALHRDVLERRRRDPVISGAAPAELHAAVLAERCWLLRWLADPLGTTAAPLDRLLIVNLDGDFHLFPPSEPLLAPPSGTHWEVEWSSDDVTYGGRGLPALETDAGWRMSGPACVLLTPRIRSQPQPDTRKAGT